MLRGMTRSSRARRAKLACVGLTVALAAGCTGDQPADDAAPTTTEATSTDAAGGPVVVAGEEMVPIAETTVPVPRDGEDEVTLGLVSLTAEGATTEMRLLMTPHFVPDEGEEASDLDDISIYDMFGGTTISQLVDVGSVTTYDIVGRADGDLETDVVYGQTTNEQPILYQAWFPRPEGDPDTLDVWLHPSWPTIEDVPVTYED